MFYCTRTLIIQGEPQPLKPFFQVASQVHFLHEIVFCRFIYPLHYPSSLQTGGVMKGVDESAKNYFMEEMNLRCNLKKWLKWLWFPLNNKSSGAIKHTIWKKKSKPQTDIMGSWGKKWIWERSMGWSRWYKGLVLLTASPPERSPIISFVSRIVAISNDPQLSIESIPLWQEPARYNLSTQSSGCVGRNQACLLYTSPSPRD